MREMLNELASYHPSMYRAVHLQDVNQYHFQYSNGVNMAKRHTIKNQSHGKVLIQVYFQCLQGIR